MSKIKDGIFFLFLECCDFAGALKLSTVGWLEKGPFSKFAWQPVFSYFNPSKTFENKKKFLDRGKIFELENFVFCPKNAHFRKKMGAHLFSKNIFLHDWQVLAHNKIQKIPTAL
jgi:hypothetical protein